MKFKYLFGLLALLFLGLLIAAPADARPSSANITHAVELIANPCTSPDIRTSSSSPALVTCESTADGLHAFISVPVPYIVDRAPNLSLVSIPTFHRLIWDSDSLGYIDTRAQIYAYPGGDPTDRLINMRLELRMKPGGSSPAADELPIENVVLNAARLSIYSVGSNAIPDYVCGQEWNTLLSVPAKQGGFVRAGDNECRGIQSLLEDYPPSAPELGDPNRYVDWKPLVPSDVITFTPYASIRGTGTDRGSPAFQLSASTSFVVEARLVWDEHREKRTVEETVCDWSYWDDYDFIDWDRWPNPVFCRREVSVEWARFCRPFSGDCPYGNPDDWWQPVAEGTAVMLRRPDGTYAQTYDIVSVQSQPLLTPP